MTGPEMGSTMDEAPKRLWLWPEEPEDGVDKFVSFPNQPYPSGSTEYVRADLHDELVKALRESAEIVHKAYVSATMEAVNAGPDHPLAKQMDAWRARCMRAETDARAALARTGEG